MKPNQQFIDALTMLDNSIFEITATNGTITTVGGDTVITFTQSGTLSVRGKGTAEMLFVGGGSGGNTSPINTNLRGGGGGGGGGIRYDAAYTLLGGTYSISVGSGGGSGVYVSAGSPDNYMGKPGGNTYLERGGSINFGAFGGGFKFGDLTQYKYDIGRNSGSQIPYINYYQSPNSVPPYGSGGSSLEGSGFTNGNGNNGGTFSIRGFNELFGAAGGGGVYAENQTKSGGLGGSGGGGNGGGTKTGTGNIIEPGKGADNTGSGGGGGSLYWTGSFTNQTYFSYGATGGSGIAIIRFKKI